MHQQACVDCHFLVKQADSRPLEIKSEHRALLCGQDYTWLGDHYSLGCYRGVWDEGYNFDLALRQAVIVLTEREKSCFFFQYQPGMLMQAAKELQEREVAVNQADRGLLSNPTSKDTSAAMEFTTLVDLVILTVLPEEYDAVCQRLDNSRPAPNAPGITNLYAWEIGEIRNADTGEEYIVAVGMIGRAGTSDSALATQNAIKLWRPRYVLFVGIAGGLKGVEKGDVVVANIVHGYEYGKLEAQEFKPRTDWTYPADMALVNNATAFSNRNSDWIYNINSTPPDGDQRKTSVIIGEVASGDKVIDDPSTKFFKKILEVWPKLKAVEMEGAGVGKAIQQAQSEGIPIGFLIIRGISDLPRPEQEGGVRGTEERDSWKRYASEVAAIFTVSFIANRLPVRPAEKETKTQIAQHETLVNLPILNLKLFQMDRSRTPENTIVFSQGKGRFPKQFSFGMQLENEVDSTMARGIYIRIKFSWRGAIPRGAPGFEAPQESEGWRTEASELYYERQAILAFEGPQLACPYSHPRSWDGFKLTIPEHMQGYFLVEYHVASAEPKINNSGELMLHLE